MNAATLSDRELYDLVKRYEQARGIVLGILKEHTRRGGRLHLSSTPGAFVGYNDLRDLFDEFFGKRRRA